MSLLSEEEIHEDYKALRGEKQPRYIEIYRAAEAALLARLASAELPEPAYVVDVCVLDRAKKCCRAIHCTRREGVYTAAQLQQAHAQGFAAGFASQLSAEPVAFTDADFMSIFVSKDIAQDCGATIELYTRREA